MQPGTTEEQDIASAAVIQRNTVRVLSVGQVFGGVAVAGSVAAGSLLPSAFPPPTCSHRSRSSHS